MTNLTKKELETYNKPLNFLTNHSEANETAKMINKNIQSINGEFLINDFSTGK